MLSEFDYFSPSILQSSVLNEYDELVQAKTVSRSGPIQFEVGGAANLYRDLSNSYLQVKCKVVQASGAALAENAPVAPVNLLLHSLFSNVSVVMNTKELTEKDSNYAYRAYLETLLTYSDEVLKTRGCVTGWFKDDAATMNAIILADAGTAKANTGFVARNAMSSLSKEITLIGRPHCDNFHQNLDIPPNCPLRITFTQTKDSFALMAAANATFKIELISATMYIRTKVGNPEMIAAHTEMLNTTPMRLPQTQVNLRTHTLAAGTRSSTIDLSIPSKLPKRIVVGFLAQAATAGTYDNNPFNFQNFGLTDLRLSLNGQSIPADGLTMDYSVGDYHRAYLNTLAALEINTGNRGIALTPKEFKQGFNLYAFKLAPGTLDNNVQPNATNGTLKLSCSFKEGLPESTDVVVYSESFSVLEIDKLGSVLTF